MLIGFEKQKKYFRNLIADGRLAHAYLFSGPDMIGKKTFALEVYEWLNNRPALGDPDIHILAPKNQDDETRIYIEDIRRLKNFLSLQPVLGIYHVVLIDGPEYMTEEASNALLKVLEEPPSAGIVILVSAHPQMLAATIRSRCLEIRFLAHPDETLHEFLASYELSHEDVQMVSILASGRLGWAKRCIEERQLSQIKKTVQEFQDILRQNVYKRLRYVQKIVEEENYLQLLEIWMYWIRSHGKDPVKKRIVLARLLKLHTLLLQPQYNHRLALENFFINI